VDYLLLDFNVSRYQDHRRQIEELAHMERDIVLTGIGGQGVQLAGSIIAKGAVRDGKYVSMLGVYGGEMRGGPSGSTLILGDAPVQAPPKVSLAWSIMSFHPKYWCQAEDKARAGTLVLYNCDLAGKEHANAIYRTVPVSATSIARGLGSEALASMVMVGAYLQITGLVSLDAVKQAMAVAIPAYRANRIEANAHAIDAGYNADLAQEDAA
jgi:2-oxoacid:acceptor oxidoreductase gamma subunit (pyruvate/2-ketoisovalerate family)